mmetsp:Transcript_115623/g.332041  ORF Transcript_115623/g.332041 Transcript_115623/m.332041 type:complete len:102 (+) Transcript_115623:189-494(+)
MRSLGALCGKSASQGAAVVADQGSTRGGSASRKGETRLCNGSLGYSHEAVWDVQPVRWWKTGRFFIGADVAVAGGATGRAQYAGRGTFAGKSCFGGTGRAV